MLCCSGERYRAIMALLLVVVRNQLCSLYFDPGPAEPRYALPLQTVQIQISRLLDQNLLRHLVCEFVDT